MWAGEGQRPEPVVIGWRGGNPNGAGCLVICAPHPADEAVEVADRYRCVVDFVAKRDGAATQAARQRYRALKEAGWEMGFHARG